MKTRIFAGFFVVSLFLILGGCGKPPDLSVETEKRQVVPRESVKLVANVENLYPGTYAAEYYWWIVTPNCGDLSSITYSSTYWKAPDEAAQNRVCTIGVKVVLRDRGHPYYEETVNRYFDFVVTPFPSANQPPVIKLITPLQDVATNETISLYVEAYDPEGEPIKDYIWWATCGKIVGDGSGVSWTAPSVVSLGGTCTVHVSVLDQEKASSGDSAEFTVVN